MAAQSKGRFPLSIPMCLSPQTAELPSYDDTVSPVDALIDANGGVVGENAQICGGPVARAMCDTPALYSRFSWPLSHCKGRRVLWYRSVRCLYPS